MNIKKLKEIVSAFVDTYIDKKKQLLLGISGGVDSIALLYLFMEQPDLQLAIAHLDHGYRQESADEALRLQDLAAQHKLPFHTARLDPQKLKGNLEDAWRMERLAFFKFLCDTHGYQGVALGHQADDQIETVLKRTLEGARLTTLSGIPPKTSINGLTLFRPLIEIEKSTLNEYAQQLDFTPFHDKSNEDTKFLRARMRLEILPALDRLFGKNVRPALKRLSEESAELKKYMDERINPYLLSVLGGPFGTLLDLSRQPLPQRFELKHLIQRFSANGGCVLSRNQLETACDLIEKGTANRRIETDTTQLQIDRRRLFLTSYYNASPCRERLELACGAWNFHGWTVEVSTFQDGSEIETASSWKEAWKGILTIKLPEGNYQLGVASPTESYPRTSEIGKWWSDHKVPAVMRNLVPVIYSENHIIHEFLTSQKQPDKCVFMKGLVIRMKRDSY